MSDFNFFLNLIQGSNTKIKKESHLLPEGFNYEDEATHICMLLEKHKKLQEYNFDSFISAGSTGLVFKVTAKDNNAFPMTLKLARRKAYELNKAMAISNNEVNALRNLSHANIIRLFDMIEDPEKGCIGILMTYIENPLGLDEYLRTILRQKPKGKLKYSQHSTERLDKTCEHLIGWVAEIADALCHMHEKDIYHFDLKPSNILVTTKEDKTTTAILADMGSCIHKSKDNRTLKLSATEAYAHPDVRTALSKKDKKDVSLDFENLSKYDLYTVGKTIQNALSIIRAEFGEKCFPRYNFRFIHLIACMLLDGKNVSGDVKDGSLFVNDNALGYTKKIFEAHKITSARELLMRIRRFPPFAISQLGSELDIMQPRYMNIVIDSHLPLTNRISDILEHPSVRRLRGEQQLGWVREVYPGATHDRLSHTAGVLSAAIDYCKWLLSDDTIPTYRVFADASDIDHIFLAALLHDIGQTSFGHDLEEAAIVHGSMFSHINYIEKLLDETFGTEAPTLREIIEVSWKKINISRLLRIIKGERNHKDNLPIDGIAMDIINGCIDADKFDYIRRDSVFCGVKYGEGIEAERFVQMLTICQHKEYPNLLQLGFKAKGRAAIDSLLLARFQMYNAVYWHHTYRCIKSMFVTAAHLTFQYIDEHCRDTNKEVRHTLNKKSKRRMFKKQDVDELFYYVVVCGQPWQRAIGEMQVNQPTILKVEPLYNGLDNEHALEFLYRFSHKGAIKLLEMIRDRDLYKRIYEVRTETIEKSDYRSIVESIKKVGRIKIADKIQENLFEKIDQARINKANDNATMTETHFADELDKLRNVEYPIVIIDYPEHGVPKVETLPEVGNKYSFHYQENTSDYSLKTIINLYKDAVALRVFVAPDFHDPIMRYLTTNDIKDCIESCIDIEWN